MNLTKALLLILLLPGLCLPGCGGAGGGGGIAGIGGGGIGGTGITSTGTIDGFGSIFVNGVEYETGKSEVLIEGQPASEGNLRLGMVVTVRGTINDDGVTGTAEQVVCGDEVAGPVSAIEYGLDGDSLLLTVLGVKVIAERTGTVFDDVTFDTLAVGDLVEVEGFVEDSQRIRATRIERKSAFVPGVSEVKLKGVVSGLTATTFNLDTYVVDFSSADLAGVPGGTVTEGMPVEVYGTLADSLLQATRVEEQDEISNGFNSDDEVSIQGAITNFVNASSFAVNGVSVDASRASLEPAGLVLADGIVVEVEGTWNGTTLVADQVKSRRGRIELQAKVASVDAGQGNFTLHFFAGTVTVQVDSRTLLDDDTGEVDTLALGDIASGDFLKVEATQVGDNLVATRVRREDVDDDILQAPVDSFNAGADITLLGIVFGTAGAEFKSRDGDSISAASFFGEVQIGNLVKIKDEERTDGFADEVEFEDNDALDGEEFEDDCDDSDSSKDCNSNDDDDDCDSSGSGSDCNSNDDDDDDEVDNCDSSGSGSDCNSNDDDDDEVDDCDSSGTGSDCNSNDDDGVDNCDSSGSGNDCEPGDDSETGAD